MRYLITGGSGFIGTNLIEDWKEKGFTLLNLDIVPPKIEGHRAFWREVDILDEAATLKAFRDFMPTHVIHLAARTDTDSNVVDDYRVNTDGSRHVFDAIKATASVENAVITSTQFVNQYNGSPRDDHDYAPHTAYGESKVIMEKLARSANLQCAWSFIRPTNIWGPWHPRYPSEFWRILGKGLYFHPGGIEVIRSYGYVKNVTWQIDRIAHAPAKDVHGRVFYVGDQPIKLLDWVNGFSRRQRGRDVIIVPKDLIKILAYIGDLFSKIGLKFPITSSRFKSMTTSNDAPMDKVFETFGVPPWSLDDGIDQTVKWLARYYPHLVSRKAL